MAIDYTKIGKNLAQRRKELRLKQYEVCERADINCKYLSNIETARSIPSLEVFIRLCQALETTPDHILFDTDQQNSHSASSENISNKIESLSPYNKRLCAAFIDMLCDDFQNNM